MSALPSAPQGAPWTQPAGHRQLALCKEKLQLRVIAPKDSARALADDKNNVVGLSGRAHPDCPSRACGERGIWSLWGRDPGARWQQCRSFCCSCRGGFWEDPQITGSGHHRQVPRTRLCDKGVGRSNAENPLGGCGADSLRSPGRPLWVTGSSCKHPSARRSTDGPRALRGHRERALPVLRSDVTNTERPKRPRIRSDN